MELFLKVIQGAYAYLLIFLILMVSTLFLTLLWLIVKRTKESSFAAAFAGAELSAIPTPSIVDIATQAPAINEAELNQLKEENQKLIMKLESLESESKNSAESVERAKTLNDKVAFLESKLLEYEILQEEISALSSLKIENEQLKQKLVKAGIAVSDTGAGLVDDTAPPQKIASPITDDAPPMIVKIPAEERSVASTPQEAQGESNVNLDSLLAEIDKLTADKTPDR